jgi:hypothetical protein
MTAMELATCRVPEDPASPTPVEGYVVTFAAFYERRFVICCNTCERSFNNYGRRSRQVWNFCGPFLAVGFNRSASG